MKTKDTGLFGEKIARMYLKEKGYRILDANYEKKWGGAAKGEIDIVAKKDGTVSFVEVKTISSGSGYFMPEEKVDFRKKRKLIRLAEMWLQDRKIPLDSKWQIDVVSIIIGPLSKEPEIRHFENAVC